MYENTNYVYPNMTPYVGNVPIGMTYPQAQQKPIMTQPLTAEEIKILIDKGGTEFNTKLTKEDLLKSICTHKKDGDVVAWENPDGSFTCPICGETFFPADLATENIEQKVNDVIDIMQTIKLAYYNAPSQAVREYFPIIPLLRKLPKLGTIAMNDFAHHEPTKAITQETAGNLNTFATYNNIMSGGPIGYQMWNPAMAQQPVYYQQPMVNNNGTPMNPNGAYPVYQQPPMQTVMMMQPNVQQQGAPMVNNEFGVYNNPAYVQQQPAQQANITPPIMNQTPVIPNATQVNGGGNAQPQNNNTGTTPVVNANGQVPPTVSQTGESMKVDVHSFTL